MEFFRSFGLQIFLNIINLFSSVVDPDPHDPYFFELLDPDPLVRGTDPDPFIIKQKKKEKT
jgi:hypothetical protein